MIIKKTWFTKHLAGMKGVYDLKHFLDVVDFPVKST